MTHDTQTMRGTRAGPRPDRCGLGRVAVAQASHRRTIARGEAQVAGSTRAGATLRTRPSFAN